MEEIKLREINFDSEDEIKSLVKLHNGMPSLWDENYSNSKEADDKLIERIKGDRDNNEVLYLVAENQSGKIVGIEWIKVKDKNSKVKAYIESIWVDESYRNSMVARRMNQEVEKWAKKHQAESISAHIHAGNPKVRKLVALMGYEEQVIRVSKKLMQY